MIDRNMFCKLKVVVDFLRIVYLPNKSKKIHKKYAKRISPTVRQFIHNKNVAASRLNCVIIYKEYINYYNYIRLFTSWIKITINESNQKFKNLRVNIYVGAKCT